jgi:hypothetical protein
MEQESYQKICEQVGENLTAKKIAILFFGNDGREKFIQALTVNFPKLKFSKENVVRKDERVDTLARLFGRLSNNFIAELKLKEEGELENVNSGKRSILETCEILSKDSSRENKSSLKSALKMYELIICSTYVEQRFILESSSLHSCSTYYLYVKFVSKSGGKDARDFFRQIIEDAARLKIIDNEDNLVENDSLRRLRFHYALYNLFRNDLMNSSNSDRSNHFDNTCLSVGNYGHQLLAVSRCVDVFQFSKYVMDIVSREKRKDVAGNVDSRILNLIYSLIQIGGPDVATIFQKSSLKPSKVGDALEKWEKYRQEIMNQICFYFPRDLARIIFDLGF